MDDLVRRIAARVNHTNGGLGLINSASAEADHYDGSLLSIVQAVLAECADELRETIGQGETLEGNGFEGGTYLAVESDELRALADRWSAGVRAPGPG